MILSAIQIQAIEKQVQLFSIDEKEEYIYEKDLPLRVCYSCGKLMEEGYCINGGCEYYCSEECLKKVVDEGKYPSDLIQQIELYASTDGYDSYYTKWNE